MQAHLVRLLSVVLLLAGGFWVASVTEWVEVDTPTPAQGEAARNDLYAIQQLARLLGAEVTTATSLDTLPPPGATLLLTSWHWNLFPERAERLRRWVGQGGHLVMYADSLGHDQLQSWLPIREEEDSEDSEEDGEPVTPRPGAPSSEPRCGILSEPESLPPSYPDGDRRFKLCPGGSSDNTLLAKPPAPVLWALNRAKGSIMLRAAFEQGSVTVIDRWEFFSNDNVVKGDHHALVAVTALQIRRGARLWLVSEESRPNLLHWLWERAWVALLLGLLSLALAVWRGGVRFGPLAVTPAHGRRSMAEQITGTARFLRRRGAPALLAAQLRALDEAAATRLRDYAQMDRSARVQAMARATGIDAQALGAALDHRTPHSRTDLASVLELLETARRLLLQSPRPPKA